MAAMKELSARWLVNMAEYIASNPVLHPGILDALDGSVTYKSSNEDSDITISMATVIPVCLTKNAQKTITVTSWYQLLHDNTDHSFIHPTCIYSTYYH